MENGKRFDRILRDMNWAKATCKLTRLDSIGSGSVVLYSILINEHASEDNISEIGRSKTDKRRTCK